MSYIIDRIPERMRIDADAGGKERRPGREKPGAKQESADTVTISEEARRRSAAEAGGAGEGGG